MGGLVRDMWQDLALWQILVAWFGLYVFSIFCFAVIYYTLYRRDERRFFFLKELTTQQVRTMGERLGARARRLATRIKALSEVCEGLANGAIEALPAVLASGNEVTGETYDVAQPHEPEPNLELAVRVWGPDGRLLCEILGLRDLDPTPDELAQCLGGYLAEWRVRELKLRKKKRKLEQEPRRSWGFWDLVYFSVGAQITAGHGDILAATTGIRMLAIVQVLWGYALLVVILRLVIVGT
jgi:hypothetical protein